MPVECWRMVSTERWTEGGGVREADFGSERELVAQFVEALVADGAPWGYLRVTSEFFYGRGRVDVVGACEEKKVIAFEAKLTRWREALHQAVQKHLPSSQVLCGPSSVRCRASLELKARVSEARSRALYVDRWSRSHSLGRTFKRSDPAVAGALGG